MIEIYIDVYIGLNFLVDLISLRSIEKICLFPHSRVRCIISSVLLTLYSVAHLFCNFLWVIDIAVMITAVLCVTGIKQPIKIIGGATVFITTQLFMGGCAVALRQSIPKEGLLMLFFLIMTVLLGDIILNMVQESTKRRLKGISLTATLCHRGKESKVLLMVDSGNLVTEHSTMNKVIFVKESAIRKSIGDTNTLFERERCYVIPIDTPSGRGTVLGFKPDSIEFSDEKYNDEEFIVVPDTRGGNFGGYDGIAPLV